MDSTRTIWGKWDCSNCGTKGISAEPPPGETQPKCPNCGSPREDSEGETPYLDNARDETGAVVDANVADTEEELAIASAGADWQCRLCNANNRASRDTCVSCGAPREGAPSVEETAQPIAQPLAQPVVPAPRRPSRFKRFLFRLAVVLVGVAFFIHWLHKPRELTASVSKMHWEQTSHLERFIPATREGWQSDLAISASVMPVNGAGDRSGVANIRDCLPKFHHNDHYQCGTAYVCHTRTRSVPDGQSCHQSCSQKSNHNGSFSESCHEVCSSKTRSESYQDCGNEAKYCDRPVLRPWCSYDTYVWSEVEAKTRTGDGADTSWESFALGPLDRLRKDGKYTVDVQLSSGGKPVTTTPPTEDEFKKWAPGMKVTVVKTHGGEVQQILRPDQVEAYREAQKKR